MFPKPVSALVYQDIDDLVNVRREREGHHLDFKVGIGNPDKAKKDLAKDVCSFANAGGGFLVIGVDKNYAIVGAERLVQNRGIDEWLNQVLSSNVEPQLFYHDPRLIEIPGSDKVIVVVHVPESSSKPHMVTEQNTYPVRVNDSSKLASHSQVREMFEYTNRRTSELSEFIDRRNLTDSDKPSFGLNNNSALLYSEVPTTLEKPKPLVLFSLIPKHPNQDKVAMSVRDLRSWLESKSRGHYPSPGTSLYFVGYDYDTRIDGLVLKYMRSAEMSSYFEVQNNGFVEAGFSSSMMHIWKKEGTAAYHGALALTDIVVYGMLLMSFAKEFYAMAKYFDEVIFQMSFVNVRGYSLISLHDRYRNGWHGDAPTNRQHENFKITYKFNPMTVTEVEILEAAKHHSERICRAFGMDQDYCFVGDEFSVREMNNFHL